MRGGSTLRGTAEECLAAFLLGACSATLFSSTTESTREKDYIKCSTHDTACNGIRGYGQIFLINKQCGTIKQSHRFCVKLSSLDIILFIITTILFLECNK